MTDSTKMQAVGQYDTSLNYAPYTSPVEVHRFGDTLRTEMGHCFAVLDEYGDWVSPTMLQLGLKSVIKVEAQT